MISKNLIVSISEDALGGDSSAITFKTTDVGNIIIEASCPKVAVKLDDIGEAVFVIKEFLATQKELKDAIDQPTFNFEYTSSEAV